MTDHRKRSRARRVEPAQLADSLDAFAARYFARRFPRPDRFAILDAIVRAVAARFGPHVCVLSLFALALALTGCGGECDAGSTVRRGAAELGTPCRAGDSCAPLDLCAVTPLGGVCAALCYDREPGRAESYADRLAESRCMAMGGRCIPWERWQSICIRRE